MCTHKIQVVNKRTGRLQYVNCGHCKACQQEKANKRTARIRNHEQTTGRIPLFITLTYDNKFIPYIRPSEFNVGRAVTVYRDVDIRYERYGKSYNTLPVAHDGVPFVVDTLLDTSSKRSFAESYFGNDRNLLFPLLRKYDYKTKEYTYLSDKCGVIVYKDFQNFYKRFEINFKREYGYRPTRSYFVTSEYGETYRRPHFHLLFFCFPEERWRIEKHIRKAWPYNGHRRKFLDIQVAKNAASYVSSYVNCGADFPEVLRLFFRPKAVASYHFGHDNLYYHLDSIIAMYERNDWSYPCTRMLDGQTFVQRVPLPRYVLSRWFPQIVGYSRLSSDSLFDCALRPHALQCLRPFAHQRDDVQGISTIRLLNAKLRYVRECQRFGRFQYDSASACCAKSEYAYLYSRVWWSYMSYLQRWSYENYDSSVDTWFNYYENILDFKNGSVHSQLSELPVPDVGIVKYDVNDQPWNVKRTQVLIELFDKKMKQSKISNLALSSKGYDV